MSFNIALSGLNAITNQLDTISNNIANSATIGFKAGRANFATMMAGTAPNGVYVGSTTQMISVAGSASGTGRGLDAAINGRGFFVTKGTDGTTSYTRAGIFQVDKDGFLTDAMNRRVQGYSTTSGLGDLQVPSGGLPAKASGSLTYSGNLSADWPVNTTLDTTAAGNGTWETENNRSATSVVYDSLGREHTVTQYFTKTSDAPAQITSYYKMDGNWVTDGGGNLVTNVAEFDTTGQIVPGTASVTLPPFTVTGADPLTLTFDYAGITSTGGDSTETRNATDGYQAGSLTDVALDKSGNLVATYSNAQKVTVGTLALANFANLDGLQATDNTSWIATAASGEPLYGTPGSGMLGDIMVGALESSNADVTGQLVELMSAQRNYQANTKVITTDEQMIQALMQAV